MALMTDGATQRPLVKISLVREVEERFSIWTALRCVSMIVHSRRSLAPYIFRPTSGLIFWPVTIDGESYHDNDVDNSSYR
jgi:hypothetical protein